VRLDFECLRRVRSVRLRRGRHGLTAALGGRLGKEGGLCEAALREGGCEGRVSRFVSGASSRNGLGSAGWHRTIGQVWSDEPDGRLLFTFWYLTCVVFRGRACRRAMRMPCKAPRLVGTLFAVERKEVKDAHVRGE